MHGLQLETWRDVFDKELVTEGFLLACLPFGSWLLVVFVAFDCGGCFF